MKIALIAKKVSESLGGAERVSLNLSGKLAEAGHDVHVFTRSIDTALDRVHLHHIPVSRWLSPWTLLSFQRKTARYLRNDTFDIVYSLCQVYPADIYRVGDGIHRHWMKVQYANSAIRWAKYMTSLVHLAMRHLENRIMARGNCKFFITNSELVKKQLIEYFSIPDEKIRVIYNGVDHATFNEGVKKYRSALRQKYRIGEDELALLFISNNWERKGLLTILDALPATGIEKIKLVIAGRGKKPAYSSLAGQRMIHPDRLVFAGHTTEIEKFYGMADIFILPSRYEPFANVCLEAMACGLPVVTTRSNGASELITTGKNGFILGDWKDSSALADSIRIMHNADSRNLLGSDAAKTSMKYTWDTHIEETMSVFQLLKSPLTP